jgi:GNAT superfamily N-acetyltransferase
MAITFELRKFSMEDLGEVGDLILKNKEEASPVSFEIDIDAYHYLICDPLVFVALDEEHIVGYSIFRVSNHPHYNKSIAIQDVIYIHPDFRKGSVGTRFYKFIEKELENTEAEAVIISHTSQKDLSLLFNRLGYNQLEVLYMKEI